MHYVDLKARKKKRTTVTDSEDGTYTCINISDRLDYKDDGRLNPEEDLRYHGQECTYDHDGSKHYDVWARFSSGAMNNGDGVFITFESNSCNYEDEMELMFELIDTARRWENNRLCRHADN